MNLNRSAIRRAGGRLRPYQRRILDRVLDRGLDTSESVSLAELGGTSPEQLDYVASGWFFLRRGLAGYPIGRDDVFVDFGCGKGRVVYQAARLPFGRVVGIELHERLTQIARANIERNRAKLTCPEVELVTGDMTQLPVPDDMTVAYLFNPVVGETFRKLMAQITASLDRRPRRLRLIYAFPTEATAVDETGRFELVVGSRGVWDAAPSLHVYESRGLAPPA